ncbi:hypothetical protein FA13DRAFT_1124567 [Coprinellus micaceus]|uniref:Uncharacterized protein n=1 Tax=Coprinellus micaceus TaxID=71717 RepID=A0A4Y7SW97_COPMI|nr:hypothetical protein FA13DRAFT_1124567 [Coprinellus micaceus]
MLAALWSSDLDAGDHHELRSLPQRAELILCTQDPRIYPTSVAPENPMAIMTHTNVPGTTAENTKHDNTSLHPLPFHQYTLMTSNAPGKRRAKSQSRVRKHVRSRGMRWGWQPQPRLYFCIHTLRRPSPRTGAWSLAHFRDLRGENGMCAFTRFIITGATPNRRKGRAR